MKFRFLLILISLSFFALTPPSDEKEHQISKIQKDDDSKFTSVGNIGLTLTNFGTYGHGFAHWPQQPSCEYPIGSGIEHLFDGGLWIGGYTSEDGQGSNRLGPFVTTGAVDASSVANRGGGFEYTNDPDNFVSERSSLIDSKFFSPDAVSHQDLIMDYTDTNTVFDNGEPVVDHSPLGLVIHQEAYAWNFPFADFFVIMNYSIKNVSSKYVDSMYVGLWTDTVVRNTNITSPRVGGPFYNKSGNGFDDSLYIAYEFDSNGDIGFTDSYVGIQYLGSSEQHDSVNFTSWQFRNTTNANFFAPQDDFQRYGKLVGFFGGTNRFNDGIDPAQLKTASNRSMLISAGSFPSLAPGDSMSVVFAIVCAKKFGNELASLDTKEQRSILYSNASWAIRAYNGEDRNANGILDEGEDLDGNGEITRYILPAPPTIPKVKVIPEDKKVTIYWDRRAEESIDPISAKKDFEGYKIYRTNAGYDLTESQDILNSLVLVSEFDSVGNDIGYNTGFDAVTLDQPVKFDGDETEYWYKYEIEDLLNGWQYIYAVTAYDEGDPENNLSSLESSPLANSNKILPGTKPTSDKGIEVGVYPNPYYGNAIWDGASERLRKIYFYNLPAECEITIYTLSGDVVRRLRHDQQSNGSDLRWFETFSKDGTQQMSGGEHAWDLVSEDDQAIATGLYLFSVKDFSNGYIKTGKFLVIK